MTIIEERDINLKSVCVVGCDGSNTVVGSICGLTAFLESRLETTVLQSGVSCYHVELYRALCRALDGCTNSKDTFEGPVGQKPSGAVREPSLVTFRPLTSAELPPLSAEADSQLISDMKVLHQCARCIVKR